MLPFGTGSKSASLRPALVIGHGTNLTIFKEGDNPFQNNFLCGFHGKYVETTGELDLEKRKFLVKEIIEVQEPVSVAEKKPTDLTIPTEKQDLNKGENAEEINATSFPNETHEENGE